MGVMALFQHHFLQNACLRVRMAPGWEHLCCIDRFLVFIVPRLFEEMWRDTVFGFPWGVVRGSEFLVGTLSP